MPSPTRSVCAPGLAFLLAACGSTPAEPDPAIEQQFLAERQAAATMNQRTYEAELIRLDQALDKYTTAWLTTELTAGQNLRDRLDAYLRQRVAKLFPRLLSTADDRANTFQRTIALAALGFSGRPEALNPLLNAARGDDHEAALAALFALAILQDPNTPANVPGEAMLDEKRPLEVRRNASLALLRLQEKTFEPAAAKPYWVRVLEMPIDTTDEAIQLHAVRGIGLLRDPEHARLVERMASHPQPKLRTAAAIAMGRMRNETSVGPLLALLGPAEKNDNVRLAARKALQELAGGVDREYDVAAWRKVFDRGNG